MGNSTVDYNDFNVVYDCILDYDITSPEGLEMACHFGGNTLNTLNEIIWYKTSCYCIEDFIHNFVNEAD